MTSRRSSGRRSRMDRHAASVTLPENLRGRWRHPTTGDIYVALRLDRRGRVVLRREGGAEFTVATPTTSAEIPWERVQ